jgi:hypothetical protein
MATFKKGDRVKFVDGKYRCTPTPDPSVVYTIRDVHPACDGVYLEELAPHLWYRADHFKLAEPDLRAVPGVPEGYRLVRIGAPKEGEWYMNWSGEAVKAPFDFQGKNNAVLEKTTKTERLWIVVDLHDGTTSQEWVADGANYLTPSKQFNALETRQTREVPA